MPDFQLSINGEKYSISTQPEMPLLWVLRDLLRLTGTKYGCGSGICGTCTVHADGEAVRSCLLPVQFAVGKKITTIEGLSKNGDHPVQQAWKAAKVPQCGYCQSGQIMQAVALLENNPQPNESEINASMSTVLCRCGTYPRIKKAMQLAVEQLKK